MEETLEQLKELPPYLQKEESDFIQFLFERRKRKEGIILRQDWAGGLEEFNSHYTSLELQKKALEWRSAL